MMKIPGGYGYVRIEIESEVRHVVYFRNVAENPVTSREISTTYTDVNDNLVKHIRGHHLDFNLQLVDYAISSGSQEYMNNFMRYYYSEDNQYADRRIKIYPNYDPSGSNWASVFPYAGYWAVLKQAPAIIDIDTYKFAGQVLVLKARTRIMMTEEEYKIKIYRESTTGAWGLYNAPLLGFSEPAATTA